MNKPLCLGILSFFFLTNSHAAQDLCTFDSVTKDCEVFNSSDKDKFTLPDGTYIPNYVRFSKVVMDKKNAARVEQDQQLELDYLNKTHEYWNQADRIFKSINKKYWAPDLWTLEVLLREPKPGDPEKLTMSWPPVTYAKETRMNIEEARGKMLAFLGSKKDSVLKLVEAYKAVPIVHHPESSIESDAQNVSPIRVERVKALVDDVRQRISEVILKGRSPEALSPEERNNLEKVKKITYNEDKIDNPFVCGGAFPNAFYNPGDNSINICRNFFNYPDSAIVGVLGHEMGHSVDPCNNQFGTYKINFDSLKGLDESEIKKDDDLWGIYMTLKGSKYPYTAAPFAMAFKPEACDYFEKRGVLEKVTSGNSFKNNPFNQIVSCLESKGFRKQDRQEIEKIATEVVKDRTDYLGKSYDKEGDRQRILKAFLTYPECVGSGKSSQMGEAFADWMGSEVLGGYLKDHPPGEGQYERLAPVSFFAALTCMSRYQNRELADGKKGSYGVINATLSEYFGKWDPHPNSKKRMDDVFLKNEGVRKALGCTPDGSACGLEGQATNGDGQRSVK